MGTVEESGEANKQIVREFLKHMSAMNAPGLAQCITDDFTVTHKGSSVLQGTYSLAEFPPLVEKLNATLPNGISLHIIDMFAERDAVVVEAKGTATSSSGKPYNNEYLLLLKVRDGRVASMTEYLDSKLVDEVFACS
jgi:ketosteroid isomerase-like protein